MRLKPRQNHEENERGPCAGETGSAKWGSRWPRSELELRLASQRDCSEAKVYERLWLLEDGAVGLNCEKYQGNFIVFWNWAWNRPQNLCVISCLIKYTCSPVFSCKNWLLTAQLSDVKGTDLASDGKTRGKFKLLNSNSYLLRLCKLCLCKGLDIDQQWVDFHR